MKAYVSSTFADLEEHRRVALETLDQLGYVSRGMEKYFATDERPLDICLEDIAQCDLFVGVVAWRYGFVPETGNSECYSITECEIREANRLGIPCLFFLSAGEDADHRIAASDDIANVTRLRKEINRDNNPGYFVSPDSLGRAISVAVHQSSKKPDFRRYLVALIAELVDLPELPNRTRNLSLADSLPIRVRFEDGSTPVLVDTTSALPLDLLTAAAEEQAWILVGEAGDGKSTALRFLGYEFGKRCLDQRERQSDETLASPVPVYISVIQKAVSLREQIWAALQAPGFRCGLEQTDVWISQQPFLFLVDHLDETDPEWACQELQNLRRRAPKSRFVVASRPTSALETLQWRQGRLEPFTISDIRSLCETLLGPVAGASLCDTLAENGMIEPFRRPLFARLLALTSPELIAHKQFTLADVFHDVLEVKFLGGWERLHEGRFETTLLREFCAQIAYNMTEDDIYSADRISLRAIGLSRLGRHGGSGDPRFVEQLLDSLTDHGILVERHSTLQFWHTSFRDYFAAVWAHRHASSMTIYLKSWSPRWHETLLLYFGLVRGHRRRIQLRVLMFGLRPMFLLLSVRPYRRISRRTLLVLQCLAQLGSDDRTLQKRFLAAAPRNLSFFYFHPGVAHTSERMRVQPYWDDHSVFCDLVGQFRIPEGVAYLKSVRTGVSTIAAGLMHDADDDTVELLVDYLLNPDGSRSSQPAYDAVPVADLLVRSFDSRYLLAIRQRLIFADESVKLKLLNVLNATFAMNRRVYSSAIMSRLRQDLCATLVQVALSEPHEDVRTLAIRLLHEFGEDRRVPPEAEEVFFASLNDDSSTIRGRALAGLIWYSLRERMNVAWRLLLDSDIGIVFDSLRFFRLIENEHFPVAMLVALRAHAKLGSDLRDAATSLQARLRDQLPQPKSRTHCIALLICAAIGGEYNGFRSEATAVLGYLRVPWTVDVLAIIYHSDDWVYTRREALIALVRILGADASPYVLEGLNAAEPELCEQAVRECLSNKTDIAFRPVATPILLRLLNHDSEEIRRYTKMTLRQWDCLPENDSDVQNQDLEGRMSKSFSLVDRQ